MGSLIGALSQSDSRSMTANQRASFKHQLKINLFFYFKPVPDIIEKWISVDRTWSKCIIHFTQCEMFCVLICQTGQQIQKWTFKMTLEFNRSFLTF